MPLLNEASAIAPTLRCPLSQQDFVDPVVAGDGWTYERDALEQWVRAHGQLSPSSGRRLHGPMLRNFSIRRICRERAEAAALGHDVLQDQWKRNLDCLVTGETMTQPVRLSDGHDYELRTVGEVVARPNGSPWSNQPFSPDGKYRPDRTMQVLCQHLGAAQQAYPAFMADGAPLSWLLPMTDPPVVDRWTHHRVCAYLDPILSDARGVGLGHSIFAHSAETRDFRTLAYHRISEFRGHSAQALMSAASNLVLRENECRGLTFLTAGPWTDKKDLWALHAAHNKYIDASIVVARILTHFRESRIDSFYVGFDSAVRRFTGARYNAHIHHLSAINVFVTMLAGQSLSVLLSSPLTAIFGGGPTSLGAMPLG